MFELLNEVEITLKDVPIQWIPKIELYYPDLPQFPIMYIHITVENKRLIACPVSVSYEIGKTKFCNATFHILTNHEPNDITINILKQELEQRIGLSDKISLTSIIDCCDGNDSYINLLQDLWTYIQESYGDYIPFGKYYEEIYSIPRFVAAWQPKTGRQSEMRMLYNFMSSFGEEAKLPEAWSHLEFYVIPNYDDVLNKSYSVFPKYEELYNCMKKVFSHCFTIDIELQATIFKTLPKAWPQNKDDFIKDVSTPLFKKGIITQDEKKILEKLVDAFNRHGWRAAFFISAFLTIETKDYMKWDKQFFKDFYAKGSKLKGYSEKVIACFLQQGFGNKEVIPIDTWIDTFQRFPLGIDKRKIFYNSFNSLGLLERVIWLASQANKTNMKNFFDILWCQRYGTIGNKKIRGTNPIACFLCKLRKNCIGYDKSQNLLIRICRKFPEKIYSNVSFVCLLEGDVPKKIYGHNKKGWFLQDEFSGYMLSPKNTLPQNLIDQKIITLSDLIDNICTDK